MRRGTRVTRRSSN
jgi:hypothetical protein